MNEKSCGLFFLFFFPDCKSLFFIIRISRGLDVHSKKLVRKLSAILKQNAISSVNLDDERDFQMMTVISPSLVLVVRKHGAPKYRTQIVDK